MAGSQKHSMASRTGSPSGYLSTSSWICVRTEVSMKKQRKNLHDAVSPSMIMDQGALSGRPDEKQKIRLPIAVVDEVSRVVATVIGVCILGPVMLGRGVVAHGAHKALHVDIRAVGA